MNLNSISSDPAGYFQTRHLVISDNKTRFALPFQNILRLESKRVYTIVYAKNKQQYVCSRNIKVVYEELQSELFFRIHKSHVINLLEVKSYREGRGGQVVMSDDTIIAVAYRKKTEFLKSFMGISPHESQSILPFY